MKQRKGTKQTKRPRIAVFRSNQHIYAQIIDDTKGVTLASASDHHVTKPKKASKEETIKIATARKVGEELAKRAQKRNISHVWFDRRNYKYHGRVRAVAEGARTGGLQF